jgi:hypothetical protein
MVPEGQLEVSHFSIFPQGSGPVTSHTQASERPRPFVTVIPLFADGVCWRPLPPSVVT